MIDEEYEVLRSRGDKWHTCEARLAEHRREIEEQAQAEVNTKVCRMAQHWHGMHLIFSIIYQVNPIISDDWVGKCFLETLLQHNLR